MAVLGTPVDEGQFALERVDVRRGGAVRAPVVVDVEDVHTRPRSQVGRIRMVRMVRPVDVVDQGVHEVVLPPRFQVSRGEVVEAAVLDEEADAHVVRLGAGADVGTVYEIAADGHAGGERPAPQADHRPDGDRGPPPETGVVAAVVDGARGIAVAQDVVQAAVVVAVVVGADDVVERGPDQDGPEIRDDRAAGAGLTAIDEDGCIVWPYDELARALADVDDVYLEIGGKRGSDEEEGQCRNHQNSSKTYSRANTHETLLITVTGSRAISGRSILRALFFADDGLLLASLPFWRSENSSPKQANRSQHTLLIGYSITSK